MGLKKKCLSSHDIREGATGKTKAKTQNRTGNRRDSGTMAAGSWRDRSICMIGYTAENSRYAVSKQRLALPCGDPRVNSR